MKKKKRLKRCPLCGNAREQLVKTVFPRSWKPYAIECCYCHFFGESAFTIRGAERKWNRATNIVSIDGKEVRHGYKFG